jgi:hypothetical protein
MYHSAMSSRSTQSAVDIHVEKLAERGFWCQVGNFEYARPKDMLDSPKAKLMPLEAPPIPYLFGKAFKHVSGKCEFGISRKGKNWIFHVRRDGMSAFHRLSKLHHITFYSDTSIELARNPSEHLYVHFAKTSTFAYSGLYKTLQFLILHKCIQDVTLNPWIPELL